MDPFGIGGLLTSQIAIGGIIGFFIGFAIKKITKLALFILGIFFIALLYLEYNGYIMINYAKFEETFGRIGGSIADQLAVPATPILTNIPLLGGFGLGFIIGLKKG
ncbi:MAG: FUN14 domain-containing protein [Candidatus Nitrosocaldus sp.]